MHPQTIESSLSKGNWLAIMSGFLYGLLGYFGVRLMGSGMSAFNVSCWRFFVSFVFMAIVFIFVPDKKYTLTKDHFRAFMNGALFYAAPSSLFFIACQYINSGQCMVIFFSFPAFVMMINRIFYGQRIKRHYFLSFALIIVGLILLVELKDLSFDLLGVLCSLLSAVFYAFYVVFSKRIILPAFPSTMMVSLGCCFTSLLMALMTKTFFVPTQETQWLFIISLAVVCTALPILLMLESLKYISSARASLLSVLEPVFTVIFGVILLGEILTMKSIVGIFITLMGAASVSLQWQWFIQRKKV